MSEPTPAPPTLLRTAAGITLWNFASRVTGFARVVVIGGAVGATFLGNTYQSANLVSNLLFELLAAGMLAAVLVPALVARLATGEREEAAHLAGAVLGRALLWLSPIVVLGALGAPALMRALTAGVGDPSVRAAQVRLGSFLLLFFLPQVLLYAVGAVTTAALQADSRFAAAAAAPVANNLVVIVTLAVFWSRGAAGLELSWIDRTILAAGTTAGVLAMTLVPMIAAARAGMRVRPHLSRVAELRPLAQRGAWAAATLAATQVFVFATVVFANRVEGGVVAYQVAFTIFLLPHALLAHPIATALFPRLAAHAHAGERAEFRDRADEGLRLLAFSLLPLSALLVALAPSVVGLLSVGALDRGAGRDLVAAALGAYGLGLVGYSGLLLLTRVAYAADDARTPALVNGAAVAVGIAVMAALSAASDGTDRVRVLGWAHTATVVGAAAVLCVVLIRRSQLGPNGAVWLRAGLWSLLAGVAARAGSDAVAAGQHSRGALLAATLVGGVSGTLVYLGGQRVTGGIQRPRIVA